MHHDPTLQRTTKMTGPLIARTLAELRSGTSIPTLQ